ncbi:hypothetical protein JCM31271_30370 [Halorubrum trueperi]
MNEKYHLNGIFDRSTLNTALSWLFVLVLAGTAYRGLVTRRYGAVLFSVVALAIVVGPAVALRDPTVIPPWFFLLLVCLPILWDTVVPFSLGTGIVPSLSLATLGLLFVVEIHHFTALRLVPWFAVVLTVLSTLAMAALLNVLRWTADVLFSTSFLLDGRTQAAINTAVMVEFVYVTVAGVLAGIIFFYYFRRVTDLSDSRTSETLPFTGATPTESALLSERLNLSIKRQRQLARGMQVLLALTFGYGLWTRQLPFLVNAGVALAITFVPALLERDFGLPVEPGLALWITSAVFLHVLGTAGLYGLLPPWDALTHTFSATVVAAAGYATLRAIYIHTPSIHLPPWAMFACTLVFVLAAGVVWELLEFAIDRSALLLGFDPVLAQHGIDDTIVDLIFDAVGAVIVAAWGTVYLVAVSDYLALQLEQRFDI